MIIPNAPAAQPEPEGVTDDDPIICRDIAHTTYSPEWSPKVVQVGSRGRGNVWAESLEEFVAGCTLCNLEWLVPPVAADALEGLG
jgi:hypothetical protein